MAWVFGCFDCVLLDLCVLVVRLVFGNSWYLFSFVCYMGLGVVVWVVGLVLICWC